MQGRQMQGQTGLTPIVSAHNGNADSQSPINSVVSAPGFCYFSRHGASASRGVTGVPHHVTQRGNARQVIFTHPGDRATYLDLLQQYSELYGLSLLEV